MFFQKGYFECEYVEMVITLQWFHIFAWELGYCFIVNLCYNKHCKSYADGQQHQHSKIPAFIMINLAPASFTGSIHFHSLIAYCEMRESKLIWVLLCCSVDARKITEEKKKKLLNAEFILAIFLYLKVICFILLLFFLFQINVSTSIFVHNIIMYTL